MLPARWVHQERSTMPPTRTAVEDLNHGLGLANFTAVADADTLVEYAVAAEDAGWDGVFLGDHLIDYRHESEPDEMWGLFDPWITLAGIATRTDTITLGTWITPVPRRQPWQLARDLATLDRLSDGRVILGAGLGTDLDYDRFGRSYDPARLGEQYDEALDVITGLWTGEPFSYDGDYYTIDEAVMRPTPVQQPRIPIVTGCWWPNKKPFQRGARWDGIMPAWPAMYGGEGAHGEEATGSPEEEAREMLEYYHGLDEDPGDVMLPIDFPDAPRDFLDTCAELGATWTVTTNYDQDYNFGLSMDQIREGPPA